MNSFLYLILVGAELWVKKMTTKLKNTLLLLAHKMQITAVPMSDAPMLQYREVTEMLRKKTPSNHDFHVLDI